MNNNGTVINVKEMYVSDLSLHIKTDIGRFDMMLNENKIYVTTPYFSLRELHIKTWNDTPKNVLKGAIIYVMDHYGIKGSIPEEVLDKFVYASEIFMPEDIKKKYYAD